MARLLKKLTDSCSAFRRAIDTLLYACTVMAFCGCSGTWVWQEDYPKHRTTFLKCPRWNYDEAYDKLHHIYTTDQHKPIKIKN